MGKKLARAFRRLLFHWDRLGSPYRYDCDSCEEEFEEGAEFCKECPFDLYRVLEKCTRDYEDFPDPDELLPSINRIIQIQRDIEILGRPLNELNEFEMFGLRILKEETDKFEKNRQHELDREVKSKNKKWQTK